MSRIVVVYRSKYGATGQYARWIAEALDAPLVEHAVMKPHRISDYDIVIYGGGLYAGGINGVELVTKNRCRSLIVFTVGVAVPEDTDYSEILEKAFSPAQMEATKVFHLRGGISYSKLSFLHRMMMTAMKKMIEKTPPEGRKSEDASVLATYGKDVDFSDRASIEPLVKYAKRLAGEGLPKGLH
ncbi:MAG: flavodoxin domain-containing protein [Defluviitaleaceae bacterium]|nr:flavodoxin domain-containing protein [Defluviitaleaceae bacterium]